MAGGGAAAAADIPDHLIVGTPGWRGLIENKKALGLATFASLGGVLYGYNQGVFGQVLVMHSFEQRYTATLTDPITKGLLTSILELGAALGSIIAGPVADSISRKRSISLWCIMFMFGVALQAGAGPSVDYIWAGRWFAGMGVGALSCLVPLYNGELAPPTIRGSLVSLQQLAITFGILISYWIGYGTNFIGGTGEGQSDAAWRIPLAIQLVPALVLLVGAFFLPYSPRWLVLRGREEEGLLTLANLRDMDPESVTIQYEFKALQAERLVELAEAKERYGAENVTLRVTLSEYWRMFSTWSLLRRLLLAVAAQSLQQLSGINAIIYYAPTIFESTGLTGPTIPLLATGVVGIVNFVMTFPAVLFVDNFGRRPMLFGGALSMTICFAIIAAIVGKYGDSFDTHKAAGNAGVFFIYWFIASFAVTWGPLAWVVSAEVFPLGLRAKGMSISAMVNWLVNFMVATVTPLMLENITYFTYIFFMIMMILACFWSIFVLPECSNKTLEEIDAIFNDASGKEDRERRERVAKELGMDKIGLQGEVQQVEKVGETETVEGRATRV